MRLNFQGLQAKEEKKQRNPKLICPRDLYNFTHFNSLVS